VRRLFEKLFRRTVPSPPEPSFTIEEIELFGSLADNCDAVVDDPTMSGMFLSPAVCARISGPLRRIGIPKERENVRNPGRDKSSIPLASRSLE